MNVSDSQNLSPKLGCLEGEERGGEWNLDPRVHHCSRGTWWVSVVALPHLSWGLGGTSDPSGWRGKGTSRLSPSFSWGGPR